MNQALVTLALGFFLGVRHATDPDHIVAITTIVTRYRRFRDAALIGACWGLGHTATILVVGGGILLSSWVIPARLGLSMEFAVGLMLIALGLAALIRTARQIRASAIPETVTVRPSVTHSHVHGHGDYIHTHPHGHEPEAHPHDPDRNPVRWLDRRFGGLKLYQLGRPLAIGVVHGLAGSAAIPLLVLAAIGDRRWALGYLALFGVGTIVGMMLLTMAVALPFMYTGARFTRFHRGLGFAAGLGSMVFGLFIAYEVGVVRGLFGPSAPALLP